MVKNLKDYLHYLFVPSEKNNFRAKTLQHDFLTYYLVLAFAFVFIFRNFGGSISHVLGVATDITTNKLYEYTNDERQKNNLPTLAYNQKLSEAAYKKAEDMFQKNYWAHFAPDGRTPWDFILNSGYSYEFAGENLAKNFLFSKNVVDAWMQSPTHRENILKPEYSDVGYAIVNGVLNGEQTTLVVQMFGKTSPNPVANAKVIPKPQVLPKSTEPQGVSEMNSNILKNEQTLGTTTTPRLSVYVISLFVVFLTLIIAIDFYVASRLNIVRIHGKSLAHFIFLIAIFFGLLLFITKGVIL